MPLKGIDIASHQAGIDLSKVEADFVIVKATGGVLYDNPEFRRQADGALAAGKRLGVYHYAREDYCPGDAATEAAHFLNAFAPYKGRAIPVLDWEGRAVSLPIEWPAHWLRAVERETGAKPWFYSYSSYVNSNDCSKLAGWPLWIAAYYAGYEQMGYQANPPLKGGTGAWSHAACYQYTSTGSLAGYDGRLDLNIFYGDGEDWDAMCGKGGAMIDIANEAAEIHRFMCDDSRFGYSWEERWGNPAETAVFKSSNGRTYEIHPGDYDCSSSVITAWRLALKGTPYEGKLDGATYTGNMRETFKRSGLFDVWDTATTVAQRGDIYLNDGFHTAMCQTPEPDMLSEFSISETGGTSGKRGDQTGWESHITEFYEYPWDVTLHYNHKADAKKDEIAGGEDMPFAFMMQPDGREELWFFSGSTVTRLTHPDQAKAIQDAHKKVFGKELPVFKFGSKKAPWAARFAQAFENRKARSGPLGDEYNMDGWSL